jgi:NAD(P)-dependent dehydrogenase (short-subunit alcohol dehydrogenase family)
MKHRLDNKRALITGGSRGIGAAIVMRLAREGANVALSYAGNSDRDTGEEIASLVSYMASPEASYLTGASLSINGGFTA